VERGGAARALGTPGASTQPRASRTHQSAIAAGKGSEGGGSQAGLVARSWLNLICDQRLSALPAAASLGSPSCSTCSRLLGPAGELLLLLLLGWPSAARAMLATSSSVRAVVAVWLQRRRSLKATNSGTWGGGVGQDGWVGWAGRAPAWWRQGQRLARGSTARRQTCWG
jgi:hypothetical protein